MSCKSRFVINCKIWGLAVGLSLITSPVLAAVSAYVGTSAGNVRQSFVTEEPVYLYVEAPDAGRVLATGIISSSSGLGFISNNKKEQISETLWRWEFTNLPEGNVTVMLAVFAGGLTPAKFSFQIVDAELNLLALHDSASSQYDSDCIKCHGTRLRETSLKKSVPPFHAAMVKAIPGYKGGTAEDCQYCHENVDSLQQSAGNLRRNVKVSACTACHGPGTAKQFYQ